MVSLEARRKFSPSIVSLPDIHLIVWSDSSLKGYIVGGLDILADSCCIDRLRINPSASQRW